MASKAVTIGDLIHRVVSSCLSNRLPSHYTLNDSGDTDLDDDDDDDPFVDFTDDVSGAKECRRSPSAAAATKEEDEGGGGEEEGGGGGQGRRAGAEALMAEVFDAVSGVRRAYAALQGAHCPWDPDKMRAADAAVVAELRHLVRLRNRFRRGPHPAPNPAAPPLREAVAPYEATLEPVHRLRRAGPRGDSGVRRTPPPPPTRDETGPHGGHPVPHQVTKIPISSPQLAKHALEEHITRVLLGGFEHELFYLDGSLSSLLNPAAFRRDRYAQFRDMRGMEPVELLGVLPTCAFGRYAASKFASLLPPHVEEAVLGDSEQEIFKTGIQFAHIGMMGLACPYWNDGTLLPTPVGES